MNSCMYVCVYVCTYTCICMCKTGASINFSVEKKEHEISIEAHFS